MNRQGLLYSLAGAGVAVLLGLYGWLAYYPLAKRLADRRHELELKKQALEEARYVLGHYDEFSERAANIRMARQRLEGRLPAQSRMAELLKEVTRLATECNIHNFQFIPKPIVSQAAVFRQPVKITVTCHYHALGAFISQLANLPRLVNTTQIQIKSKDKTGKTDAITAEIEVETYVRHTQ